jgi:hypothetical protein
MEGGNGVGAQETPVLIDTNVFVIDLMQHLFDILKKGVSLGDALVLSVAGRYLPFALTLVTWDRDHFEEKFPGEVLTPEQYLRSM